MTNNSKPRRVMPWGDVLKATETAPDGLLFVDKVSGVTSHDVVGAVRRLAGTRKVGHAGTLDPMATGLLTIGVGRATKLLHYLTGEKKTYRARIVLGITTTTEDAHGEVVTRADSGQLAKITPALVDTVLATFRGDILQRPSSVSAIKVAGKRAYDLVRAGEAVELASRPISIYQLERETDLLPAMAGTGLEFEILVECSAGTYIRALARDIGEVLGVGAHLTMLRRVRVGNWQVDMAHTVSQLLLMPNSLPILGMSEVCKQTFPCIEITDSECADLRFGKFIAYRDPQFFQSTISQPFAAFNNNQVIALVSKRGKQLKPDLNLASIDV